MANELVLENGVWKLKEAPATTSGGGARFLAPISKTVPRFLTTGPLVSVEPRKIPIADVTLGVDPYSIENISQIVPLNLGTLSLFLGAGTETGKTPIEYAATNRNTASDLFNFGFTDSFSVSFWCKMPTFGSVTVPFLGTWDSDPGLTGNRGWLIYQRGAAPGKLSFLIGTSGGPVGGKYILVTSTVDMNFTNNDWNHIVIVWSGSSSPSLSNTTMDFDGVSQSLSNQSLGTIVTGAGHETHASQNCALIAGAYSISNTQVVSTRELRIDELGIWNGALTQTEVNTLYNNGDGALCTAVSTKLVARYSMDEPSPRLGPRDAIGSNHLSNVSI